MSEPQPRLAQIASEAPLRDKPSNYPEPFASMMSGRQKRPLGDLFGISSFGVNLTRIPPDAVTALHHSHSVQDEMVYVLEGNPTLFLGEQVQELRPGMVVGFPHDGPAHHLENRTDRDAVILEIGDRQPGDAVSYPNDDLIAAKTDDGWAFTHKDGRSY